MALSLIELDPVEVSQLTDLSYGFTFAEIADAHRESLSATKRRQTKINQTLGARNSVAAVAMAIRLRLV